MTGKLIAHKFGDYTHPRKGTETVKLLGYDSWQSWIILIPARGRKPRRGGTPTGGLKIILIPARGRKPPFSRLSAPTHADYTHPRKGTETSSANLVTRISADYTHPRKGTETHSECR